MNLQHIFNSFNDTKVLIIGDVMIDAYVWGKVERISPEAPVPIVAVQKKEERLGGAANVVLNIEAMGATPFICSVIGEDSAGERFLKLLEAEKVSAEGIIKSKDRVTTVKTRVIGHHQHVLRIDDEVEKNLTHKESENLFVKVTSLLDKHRIEVIIFEDYDKGILSKELIEKVVAEAKKRTIPVVVDPKKKNFLHYKNVTLFKPNLKELKEGLKHDFDHHNIDELKKAVAMLKEKIHADMLMVTLSEMGVLISANGKDHHIPAHIRNIADVSGAGDTVISVAALGLAKKLNPSVFAALSNLAGGLVCEHVGVISVNKEQLFQEALKENIK